jgi:glutamyl/glutaminyl-tRNA synthetase
MAYIGRIAPSPTGWLHLGHARTFWIAQERARAAGGQLMLREEDLDPQRSRGEFAEAMREDLRWLGVTWDSELRQSERMPLYRAAMGRLLAAGLAYPCRCSRRDLAESTQAPHEEDDEPIYNGRCRPSPVEASTEISPETNYRFRIPSAGGVTFNDLHAGAQAFTPGTDFGDFVLWRKDGLPSYQLACVVDDALTGITEVVRGRDLLKSTGRQILLQRALGYGTPAYFHVDLMVDGNGVRLAKRHDALSLRTLRESGAGPQDVLAMF